MKKLFILTTLMLGNALYAMEADEQNPKHRQGEKTGFIEALGGQEEYDKFQLQYEVELDNALMRAINAIKLDEVKQELEKGASITRLEETQRKPVLHLLVDAWKNYKYGGKPIIVSIAQLLIQYGAKTTAVDATKNTATSQAIKSGLIQFKEAEELFEKEKGNCVIQ